MESNDKDESTWTAKLVLEHLKEVIHLNDKRYAEQFESSKEARITAFMASEKAIKDTLASVEKGTASEKESTEKAVALVEANAERWRADASEWRARMTDREKSFCTRTEFDLLKERVVNSEGSGTGKKDLWVIIVGVIMMLIGIFGVAATYLK